MAALVACPPTDLPAAPQSPGDVMLTTRLSPAVLSDRETPPSRAQEESEWRREEMMKPQAEKRSCSSVQAQTEFALSQPPRPLREVLQARFAALQSVSDLLSEKQREKALVRRRAIKARENAQASTSLEKREEWRKVLRECEAEQSEVSKAIAALTSEKCARTKEKDATLDQIAAARRRSRGSKEHLQLLRIVWELEREEREVDALVDELVDEVVAEDKDVEAEEVDSYLEELLGDLAAEEDESKKIKAPSGEGESGLEVEAQEEDFPGCEAELRSVPAICGDEVVVKTDAECEDECRRATNEQTLKEVACGEKKPGAQSQIPFFEKAFIVMTRALEDASAEYQEEQERLIPKASKKCVKSTPSPELKTAPVQEPDSGHNANACVMGMGFVNRDPEALRKEEQDRKAAIEAILRKYDVEEKRTGDAARGKDKEKAVKLMNKSVDTSTGSEKRGRTPSLPSTSTAHHMGGPTVNISDEFIDTGALIWALVALVLSTVGLFLLF